MDSSGSFSHGSSTTHLSPSGNAAVHHPSWQANVGMSQGPLLYLQDPTTQSHPHHLNVINPADILPTAFYSQTRGQNSPYHPAHHGPGTTGGRHGDMVFSTGPGGHALAAYGHNSMNGFISNADLYNHRSVSSCDCLIRFKRTAQTEPFMMVVGIYQRFFMKNLTAQGHTGAFPRYNGRKKIDRHVGGGAQPAQKSHLAQENE